jgi:hypothetical protein
MSEAENAAVKLNIVQKLARIRSIADVAVKDKRGYNYSYADITQILAQVKAGMKKYGISLIPTITPGTSKVTQVTTVNSKFTKTGDPYEQKTTEMLYQADMVFRWVDDDDPDIYIDVPWTVTGSQADPSQAFGSAMTYCTRYFLTNYFQIAQAQAEDVDAYRSRQKEAEASEEKAVADEIIKQVDTEVKTYIADHPDKAEEVKKFIQRYVKGADYFKIKEPKLAAKLLEDFRATYINT